MLDEEHNQNRRKLQEAINKAVKQSDLVRDTIEDIRAEGYEVVLLLEATIGFNKLSSEPALTELSEADRRFLRALKIRSE